MQKEIKTSLKKFGRLLLVAGMVIAIIAVTIGLSIGRQESVQTETQEVSVGRDAPLTLMYFYKDT